MTRNRKRLSALAILIGASLGCGAGLDEPEPSGMDVEPLDAGPSETGGPASKLNEVALQLGLTEWLDALTRASLTETLSGPGPWTAFVPANSALRNLAPDDLEPALLANLLLHHLVEGESTRASILRSGELSTQAGTTLTLDASTEPVLIGGAALSATYDAKATNGILHVIDDVMLPPRIDAFVRASPELSSLAAAAERSSSEVGRYFAGSDAITVFAPINSAFEGIDVDALSQTRLDEILRNHILTGQILSRDLADGQILSTTRGGTLSVRIDQDGRLHLVGSDGGVARVLTPNLRLRNGTLHLIDAVLDPGPPITNNLGQAAQEAGLSALTAAATGGFEELLRASGAWTLFGPTDEAFMAARSLIPSDSELVANVLLHHLVPGTLSSATVLSSPSLLTAAKTTLTVDPGANPPTVGGGQLADPLDSAATNGVLHVVDRVLIPPTIQGLIEAEEQLSTLTLAAAGANSEVGNALGGSAAITVFAPVNSAFDRVDVGALRMEPDRLTDILGYHIANGQRLASDLSDGLILTMSTGAPLTVSVDGDRVTLSDGLGGTATVLNTDTRVLNGVVHLIDGVLNPGNLFERGLSTGLSTWTNAVRRVDLTQLLRAPGALTLFAPDNAAFVTLGVDLASIDADILANLLLFHLVEGRNDAATMTTLARLDSEANLPLLVSAAPLAVGGIPLSSARDLSASNGILHVLEGVLLPPTIPEVLGTVPDLSIAVQAINRASPATRAALTPDTLTGGAPVTVFAPLNNGFLGQNIDVASLPLSQLDALLGYHIVPGQILSTDLVPGPQMLTTMTGGQLLLDRQGSTITIVDAAGGRGRIDAGLKDLRTLNGVVHVIDRVLEAQ